MGLLGKVSAAVKAETQGEVPKSFLDKVITSTPVVMTVVATVLAGLSSGEMSTAQYHRAMAAQTQSKAGDQWSFYQAKRTRQANSENTMDLLQGNGSAGTGAIDPSFFNQAPVKLIELAGQLQAADQESKPDTSPATPDALQTGATEAKSLAAQWQQLLTDPSSAPAMRVLQTGEVPHIAEQPVNDKDIKVVLDAIEAVKAEEEIDGLARKVSQSQFEAAMAKAQSNQHAFDAATKPVQRFIDRAGKLVAAESMLARRIDDPFREGSNMRPTTAPSTAPTTTALAPIADALRRHAKALSGEFTAARLRFTARRYQAESAYNLATAQLFEVDVHRSSVRSERHRLRSKNFFYGMLAAQAAVTIATLSLAVKQRSLLWTLATVAGALAVALGTYVYLFT